MTIARSIGWMRISGGRREHGPRLSGSGVILVRSRLVAQK